MKIETTYRAVAKLDELTSKLVGLVDDSKSQIAAAESDEEAEIILARLIVSMRHVNEDFENIAAKVAFFRTELLSNNYRESAEEDFRNRVYG